MFGLPRLNLRLKQLNFRLLLYIMLLLSVLLPSVAHADWEPLHRDKATYNQGVEALLAGAPDHAEVAFRQVLEKDPSCGKAGHGLAVALLRQNRAEEAVDLLTELAIRYPNQPDALTGLSVASFAAMDFATARTAALQAVALDVTSLEANAALISVLLRQGEVAVAQQAIEDARGKVAGPALACLEAQVLLEGELDAQAAALLPYCRQTIYTDLSANISAALSASPESATGELAAHVGADPVARTVEAVQLLSAGEAGEAEALLTEVLASSPARLDARVVRAQARWALGDAAGARDDLTVAFSGDAWVEVHRTGAMSGILLKSHEEQLAAVLREGAALMVTMLVESGDLDGAQHQLSQARQVWGEGPELATAEAVILYASGDVAGGWQRAEQALTTWPAAPAPLELVARWALASPDQLTDGAAAALQASPRWQDHYNLSIIYYKLSDDAACLRVVHRATGEGGAARDEASRRQLWALGYRCATRAGDLESADEALRRTGRPGELDQIARVNHALLRYNAGQHQEALRVLKGLEGEPKVTALASAISTRVYGLEGDWDQALTAAVTAPASDRYWLAGELSAAGQLLPARRLLTGTCDQLDAEPRARCSQLYAQLGGSL